MQLYVPALSPGPSGFPIFVVLDANSFFGTAVETTRSLTSGSETPPTVIVGIAVEAAASDQDARLYDFTSPVPERDLPPRVREQGIPVGGVGHFAHFLAEDLLPLLDRLVPADRRCRSVFGHSLAGLGVLHIMLRRPNMFESYTAASPSLWWGNRRILGEMGEFTDAQPRNDPKPRLLLTVGGQEQEIPDNLRRLDPARVTRIEGYRMVDNAFDLRRLLSSPRAPARVSFNLFQGETHASVVPAAMSRALRFAGQCQAPDQAQ